MTLDRTMVTPIPLKPAPRQGLWGGGPLKTLKTLS
jgi:hypothetical protein